MLDRHSPFDTTVRFQSEKLADFAHARLCDALVRCDIEPGAVISESAMAQRLGLGKAPVRAALARMAAEGWVQPAPRRGYLVSPITLGSIQDIFEMRRALEPLLAGAAPAASELVEINRQKSMADALRQSASDTAQSSTMQVARKIRSLLLAATNNRLLQASLPHLWDLSDRLDNYLARSGRTAPNASYWADLGTLVLSDERAMAASAIEDAVWALQGAMEREFAALGRDVPLVAPGNSDAFARPAVKPSSRTDMQDGSAQPHPSQPVSPNKN